MNINQVFEDILKLIKLFDKRKKSFGLVLKGKFGTNVQSLLSEFKYTAKEFDVKDLSQAQVDLHHLKGDLTSKKVFLLRFFDVYFLNGKFGKNVQHLLSGFKYVAKEFAVKDQSQAQVDLHHLKGDIIAKKDVLLRFFDAKNEVVTTYSASPLRFAP